MSEIEIHCPHCGQSCVVEESLFGQEATCPSCTKSFLLVPPPFPQGSAAPSAPPPPFRGNPPPPPPMPFPPPQSAPYNAAGAPPCPPQPPASSVFTGGLNSMAGLDILVNNRFAAWENGIRRKVQWADIALLGVLFVLFLLKMLLMGAKDAFPGWFLAIGAGIAVLGTILNAAFLPLCDEMLVKCSHRISSPRILRILGWCFLLAGLLCVASAMLAMQKPIPFSIFFPGGVYFLLAGVTLLNPATLNIRVAPDSALTDDAITLHMLLPKTQLFALPYILLSCGIAAALRIFLLRGEEMATAFSSAIVIPALAGVIFLAPLVTYILYLILHCFFAIVDAILSIPRILQNR